MWYSMRHDRNVKPKPGFTKVIFLDDFGGGWLPPPSPEDFLPEWHVEVEEIDSGLDADRSWRIDARKSD